jgi:hypothetical protein
MPRQTLLYPQGGGKPQKGEGLYYLSRLTNRTRFIHDVEVNTVLYVFTVVHVVSPIAVSGRAPGSEPERSDIEIPSVRDRNRSVDA